MKFSKKNLFLILAISLLIVYGTSLKLKNEKNVIKRDGSEANKLTINQKNEIIVKSNEIKPDQNTRINENNNNSHSNGDNTIKHSLFSSNDLTGDCDCTKGKLEIFTPQPKTPKTNIVIIHDIKITIPIAKKYTFFVSRFGRDEISAFLFDYLDDVFQEDIVLEFIKIYYQLFRIEYNPEQDPFEENYMTSGKKKGFHQNYETRAGSLQIQYDVDLDSQSKFEIKNRALYEYSISVPQLRIAFKDWTWRYHGGEKQDFAMDFVELYDENGDGRLSPIELFTGMILENVSNRQCEFCLRNIHEKLEQIFEHIACTTDKTYVNSEFMAAKLRHLIRTKKEEYDIYKCKNYDYHENIMQDFVQKSIETHNLYFSAGMDLKKKSDEENKEKSLGKITLETFKIGILMGFLKRQVSKTTIYISESVKSRFFEDIEDQKFKTKDVPWWAVGIDYRNYKEGRWENKNTDTKCKSLADAETRDCFGRKLLAY